eukprot:CAMPEP_0116896990 /NCGR_PEP_ID=MMETSP0467-20121206/6103_1 /TAXON_ID=283647 /ORGANISM="Mesodinium pulex, Strain SPMC105" /LENGTH=176 /DNA_ID=CAMNT_0004568451 /DNA_START=618 /DNA_END=1148 /DNA_ORIENTATION=+
MLAELLHHAAELLRGLLPVHFVQNCIRTRLHRNVEERVDLRVLQHVCNGTQVFENVGGVGHADAQHHFGVLLEQQNDVVQQFDDGGVQVDALRTRVFARQPDFQDSQVDHFLYAVQNGLDGVRLQVAACVLGFALGARPQTATVYRHDFYLLVPTYFGQGQRWQVSVSSEFDYIVL